MTPLLDNVKAGAKKALASAGFTVEKRDRLAEQIPQNYLRSPYLPPIYRDSIARLLYFARMFERITPVAGDIVECGVSIGTGILNWSLLTELKRQDRRIFGFDSFEGFPSSIEADRKKDGRFETQRGDYASPPELVLKLLEHGRVSPNFIRNNLRLVRGFFDKTLSTYSGQIALLHLDCDLYESYKVCLERLYELVQPGGAILFDEYEDQSFPGAKRAVDEFFSNKPEKPMEYTDYQYLKYYVIKR